MNKVKTVTNHFDIDAQRKPQAPAEASQDRRDWLSEAVGRRYEGCTLNGFLIDPGKADEMRLAVNQCREYVKNFREHVKRGSSIVFIGPKGTGKDHLMISVLRAIVTGYGVSTHRVRYVDGLSMYRSFRDAIKRNEPESDLIDALAKPDLLAISDPLPPSGELSEYEKRMLIQLVDKRYRECRPMSATLNVMDRTELESRIGPQVADRLIDASAVVVKCNWQSYRSGATK